MLDICVVREVVEVRVEGRSEGVVVVRDGIYSLDWKVGSTATLVNEVKIKKRQPQLTREFFYPDLPATSLTN